jgi:lysozyme family protein
MFDIAFARVFENEGAFQNDPNDRGNWTSGAIGLGQLNGTKYGISAMSYPTVDIRNLTLSEAKAIYRRDWWNALGMEGYPKALRYQLFDAAINHGMHNATRILQFAVNTKADGIIGPVTKAAINTTEVNDLLLRFLAERLTFMTDVRTWDHFGKGWARRIAHNLILASKDN